MIHVTMCTKRTVPTPCESELPAHSTRYFWSTVLAA